MTQPLIPPTPTDDDYRTAAPPPDDQAFFAESEPLALFARWLEDAKRSEPNDPNAMSLATTDEAGLPDVRLVLLKDLTPAGFGFYTNLDSAKGRQLAANPQAAIAFHWKSLRRQVRARGAVVRIPDDEADAYFATRARDSQLGAWASAQSRPLEGRFALEAEIARQAARFGLGRPPRPPHWGGFRLAPLQIEFWRDRPFRLHDRLQFHRDALEAGWARRRLYP